VVIPLLEKQVNSVFNDTFKILTLARESKIVTILALLLLFNQFAFSQRKSDIGIFAGTSYYMGDLNPVKHFYLPGYAIGPMYRYNLEPRNSFRVSAIFHNLSGKSRNYGDRYVESLNSDFDATFIDAAANYEINFRPYKTANKKMKRSLYLSAGIGYHIALTSRAQNHLIIPFGIGYKFNVAKKLSAGCELSSRKTFSDIAIDGVNNIGGNTKNLFGNNDWYTFAGIFISYKIFNFREDCPTYD
jgi:hypothetical protein